MNSFYFLSIFVLLTFYYSYSLKNLPRKSNLMRIFSSIEDMNYVPDIIQPVKFCGAGCVILADSNEFSHFFNKAAVFIYQYSINDGAQGVILERPTAFSMGESSPGIGVFESNTLFTGGDSGMDTAVMFGKYNLPGTCKYVGSGIYLGGIKYAREKVMNGEARPKDFKFFFRISEWAPGILEKEIEEGKWECVKVPPADILSQDSESNLWSKARNTIASIKLNYKSE